VERCLRWSLQNRTEESVQELRNRADKLRSRCGSKFVIVVEHVDVARYGNARSRARGREST
jgi:hypothetical protein